MQRALIQRKYSGIDATVGEFYAVVGTTELKLMVIERPWLNNKSNKSCIPAGTYRVIWSKSPRLRKFTYEIMDVKGRAGIRIHAGNTASDSLGCPLFGMRFGALRGHKAVLASREAIRRFEKLFNGQTFLLEVRDV